LDAANEEEIDSAFAAMARERPDALLLDPDSLLEQPPREAQSRTRRSARTADSDSRDFEDHQYLATELQPVLDVIVKSGPRS
jgi:hypothetical protein